MKKVILLFILMYSIISGSEHCHVKTNSLNYFINGSKQQPVLMIISGIHGDERSGIETNFELTKYIPPVGTLIIVPEANLPASKNGNRTEYYMEDLNRVFFQSYTDFSSQIATEITELIKLYKPHIILDFHESYHNYDETKNPNFYIGNTIIFDKNTVEQVPELIMEFIEQGFTPLNASIKGSLSKEIPHHLGIPVITVEVSRDESMQARKEKLKNLVQTTIKYLDME